MDRKMLNELIDLMETFIDAKRRARLSEDSPAYEIKNWASVAEGEKAKLVAALEAIFQESPPTAR